MKAKMDLENKGIEIFPEMDFVIISNIICYLIVSDHINTYKLSLIALQEKLEREAAGLKAKLNEADERTAKVWTL